MSGAPRGGGGGGGRSFPVYIDLITRGADQAAGQIKSLESSLGNVGNVSSKAAAGLDQTSSASRAAASGMQSVGSAAKLTSQGLKAGVDNANTFSAGLKTVKQSGDSISGSMNQASASINKLGVGTSRVKTGLTAFREAGRGAQFAIIGLIGSVNEAVFMIQSYAEAQQKVGAAQAEVDRVMAEGGENTSEYTRAVHDLQDAQRGAQFTSRIMAQSILDNVTFSGMLLSQLPKVISKYRELRQTATGASSVLGQQGGIISRLRGFLGGLVSDAGRLPPVIKSGEQTIKGFGTAAAQTGGALVGTGDKIKNLSATLPAVGASAKTAATTIANLGTSATQAGGAIIGTAGNIGRISPVLNAMTASSGAAAASTVPLAAGMKLVDNTSKTLIPGNARMAATTAAMIPANTGAALSFGALGAAMQKAGQASFNFVMTPLGLIMTLLGSVATLVIALREDWGGLTTTSRNLSKSLNEQADSLASQADNYGVLSGAVKGYTDYVKAYAGVNDFLLNSIGAQTEAQKKASQEQETAKQKTDELVAAVQDASAEVLGYGASWDATAEDIKGFLESVAGAQIQWQDAMVTSWNAVQAQLAKNPADEGAKEFEKTLITMRSRVAGGLLEIKSILADTSTDWGEKITSMTNVATQMPAALEQLPTLIRQPMEEAVTALDEAWDKNEISFTEFGEIVDAVINGQVVPHLDKLSASAGANLQKVSKYMQDNKNDWISSGDAAGVFGTLVFTALQEVGTGADEAATKTDTLTLAFAQLDQALITSGNRAADAAVYHKEFGEALTAEEQAAVNASTPYAQLTQSYVDASNALQPLLDQMGIKLDLDAMNLGSTSEQIRIEKALYDALGIVIQNTDEKTNSLRAQNIAIAFQLGLMNDQASAERVLQAIMGASNQELQNGVDKYPELAGGKKEAAAATDELSKAEKERLETVQQEAAAVGYIVTVNKDNAESVEYVTKALTGLNEEAKKNQSSNQITIDQITKEGQAFNENAVMLDAQAKGMQTWRDAQAQAYSTIVETASALGFQGEKTKANVVAMLDHIAVTERQNEANQTAVEGFFSLSEEQRKLIDSSGTMAERMGQVALAADDVTVADANVIAQQVKLNEQNQSAVETYLLLDKAQKANLETLGITPELIQQVIDGQITLTDAMLQSINAEGMAAEAVDSHKEAIGEMLPVLQQYADTLGLVGLTAAELGPVEEAMTAHLSELGPMVADATKQTMDFVAANGKLADVAGMGVGELINFALTMDTTSESAEAATKRHEEAAKALADSWEAELDRAVKAWETTSDQLKTAAEDIGDDIGDAGAEAATKFTDEFLGEFVPQQLVEEAFDKNIDIEDVIDDIQDEADDALDDGLISKMTMDQAIDPMIEALEEIPGENEKSMGEAIAVWRHYSQNLRPILVGGIHEVGQDAVKAFETGVFQPLQDQLQAGGGAGVWGGLVDNFTNVVNQLPPEYDRMRGDFLKTLELTKGDTRAQINAILPILREINPEWAKIVEEMDTDGDGIKDMFDTDVKSPAEQARDALLDVWIAVFDAWSQVDPLFKKAADSLRGFKEDIILTADAAQTAGVSTDVFRGDVSKLQGQFGLTASEASNLRSQFDGFNTSTGAGVKMSKDFKEGLEKLNPQARQEAIDIFEAATKTDLFADGIETAGTNSATATGNIGTVGGTAATAAGQIDTLTGSVNGFNTAIGTMFGQMADKAIENKDPMSAFDFMMFGQLADQQAEEKGGEEGGGGMQFDPAPINDYIAKLTELQTKVQTVLPAIETSWTTMLSNNGAQITAFLSGPLTQLAIAYTAYQTSVIPILAGMELAWTNHLANNGAQITTFITGPLTMLSQAYMLYQTNVIPILTAMELAWTNHLANNGEQIIAFVAGPLSQLVNIYAMNLLLVPDIIAAMELAWTNHLANSGEQINSFLSGPVVGYMNVMGALAQSVHENLETSNQNWAAHAGHVGNMASEAGGHVKSLSDDVSNSMGRITQDMGTAEQAARDLQSAIDALHDKNITVTTTFKTVGAAPAQHGINTTVGGHKGPALILAGEAGPERVTVTPMQGAATTHSGISPLAGGLIGAAKGMDAIVRPLDNKMVADFVGQRGHRLREIKDEMDKEGKEVVRVERVYKNVPRMSKDEWKEFADAIGWRVSDYDKKSYGFEVDLKPKKHSRVLPEDLDAPEGFTDNIGDRGPGFRGHALDEDADSGAFRAQTAAGAFQRPRAAATTAGGGGGGGTGGGGGGATGAAGTITKVNFAGPVVVQTSLNLTLEMDHQKLGRLVRELSAEGYAQTK